jgi:DNA-binding NarL/FixJ family response regulator
MITISIVEDIPQIREGLASLINSGSDFKCISTFGDCESAIKNIRINTPNVVLMDIGLPGMSGIQGIKILKEFMPDLDILVLSVSIDDKVVFESLCAGAAGYLVKGDPPQKILAAIHEVFNGGAPMSTQIARMVVNSFKVNPSPKLTERETEVLIQLCKGMGYKSIGDTLFISEETVRRHIKNIYKKLEVHSKSEAVAKAIKEKMV